MKPILTKIACVLALALVSSGAQAQTMAEGPADAAASKPEDRRLSPEGAVALATFYVGLSNMCAGVLLVIPGAVMTAVASDTREICDATACAEVREVKDQELHSTGVAFMAAGGVVAFTGLVTLVMGLVLSDDLDEEEAAWVPKPGAKGITWHF